MTDLERRALRRVAGCDSIDELRRVMRNALGGPGLVHRAAMIRLIDVCVGPRSDRIVHACWSMVISIEEIRRDMGLKVWRMHRLRPKIEKDGERAALEYCARHRTDGFEEVLGYGLPHLTAEAIVLHHPMISPRTRWNAQESGFRRPESTSTHCWPRPCMTVPRRGRVPDRGSVRSLAGRFRKSRPAGGTERLAD